MAKKKIKKLLKGLGVGAALLGAGRALMNRRDKANQMKEFLATEGGDLSDMSGMINEFGMAPVNRRGSILANPGINRITDYYGENLKKGGRVGCGVAKRGFGKAMKKGGKK